MRKIAVDGNLLCGKKTGMGMVVHHILRHWKADEGCQITLYLPQKPDDMGRLLDAGLTVKVLGECSYPKWEQQVLPRAIKQDGADVLWCPYNTAPLKVSCKIVVTVNDVIYMETPLQNTPSLYKKLGLLYRRYIVPRAVKNAAKIITISRFAEGEILRFFPKARNKIRVIYPGMEFLTEHLTEAEQERFFKAHGIQKPFILGFGSLERRKNTIGLLRAYEQLPERLRQEYQLVLFGFRGYESSPEQEHIRQNRLDEVKALSYISDREKNTLYRESSVFVFPTLAEGFGLPVLEAFANETPVVTSNVTSLPEVGGEAALYADPKDTAALAAQIIAVLEQSELSQALIRAGRERLQKFRWDSAAAAVLDILRTV